MKLPSDVTNPEAAIAAAERLLAAHADIERREAEDKQARADFDQQAREFLYKHSPESFPKEPSVAVFRAKQYLGEA